MAADASQRADTPSRAPAPEDAPAPVSRIERPLEGVGVVVTRDEDEGGPLTRALAALGADVLHWPTIRAAHPEDPGVLEKALQARHDWVVFTSRRAVAAVRRISSDAPAPAVAVVGRSTAEAVRALGWRVDLVPDEETGEGLVRALAEAGVGNGDRVLLPVSQIARPTVGEGLRDLGAVVDSPVAYQILPAPLDVDECLAAAENGRAGVVTVTSPSTVENLETALGDGPFAALARSAVFAAIGPTTAGAAREAGAERVIEAASPSFEALAAVVAERCGVAERGGAE